MLKLSAMIPLVHDSKHYLTHPDFICTIQALVTDLTLIESYRDGHSPFVHFNLPLSKEHYHRGPSLKVQIQV